MPAAIPHEHDTPRSAPSISPGDRYLNIVLKNSEDNGPSTFTEVHRATPPRFAMQSDCCSICNLPRNARGEATSPAPTNHESTIAHMVCLTHSNPPSHLDRTRKGLKYLSSYGWDPDSRQGLGATGEGIRAPIKAQAKNDTVGLGVKMMMKKKAPPDTKLKKLDAKQVRKKDIEDRRKRERLQETFYGNDDVERYFAGGC